MNIEEAKQLILSSDEYHKQMEYLGRGGSGIIHGFGNIAVKHETSSNPNINRQRIAKWHEDYIALSEKGKGLHFAPHFDYLLKETDQTDKLLHRFSFMQRIFGETIKHPNGLKRLVNIGTGGLKTFFNDYPALTELGFYIYPDDSSSDNHIITDKHIYTVDMEPKKIAQKLTDEEKETLNLYASATILNHWHSIMVMQQKNGFNNLQEMFKEVAGNTEAALSTTKCSSLALAKVKLMRKSDFSKNLIVY